MATDLSQDSVLRFLQSSGGSAKNSDLLLHFKNFIRDHEDRNRNRELFKKYVNSVATVRQDGGVSYVVVRKQFKGYVPAGGDSGAGPPGPSWAPTGRSAAPSPRSIDPIPAASTEKSKLKTPAPAGQTVKERVLPAAGIMVNNNNNMQTDVNVKKLLNNKPEVTGRRPAAAQVVIQTTEKPELKTHSRSEPPPPAQPTKGAQRVVFGPPPGVTPVGLMVQQQVPPPQTLRGRDASAWPDGGLHQEPHPTSEVIPRRIRYRPSYKSAVSCDEEEEDEEDVPVRRSSGEAVWPQSAPLRDAGRIMSSSSPGVLDPPAHPSVTSSCSSASSERSFPKIFIQDMDSEMFSPRGPEQGFDSGLELRGQWAGRGLEPEFLSGQSTRDLPLEAEHPPPDPRSHHNAHQAHRYSQPGVQLEPTQGLRQDQKGLPSFSHSSISSPSSSSDGRFSSSDWPPSGSSRGSGWSSNAGDAGRAAEIPQVLQPTQGAALYLGNSKATSSSLYDSTGSLHDDREPTRGWSSCHSSPGHVHDDQESTASVLHLHHSTGDLDIREQMESSEGSTSTPVQRLRPAVARRLSREVKSRMCRSLGADLDQILQEEMSTGASSEVARLNRLQMISSSLSLRANLSSSSLSSCSTPPRCHSLAELDEGMERRGGKGSVPKAASSTSQHEGHGRQSLVPLEPREHAWLVRGAAGAWTDIYSLFREDSSLLNKQDFISGFTVLHWIAKHGDHRVLNTLWYGVQKVGLTFHINVRSTCGHTPLHIAAIHGNKNIIQLLVKKFSADVKLRDVAGKRPWQYLNCNISADIFQLLGAPARAALGVGKEDLSWKQQQQQQKHRLRRHHLSSASSGERPLTIAVTNKVKRSTSLAAFLKHKSLHPFHGHQSDSSV